MPLLRQIAVAVVAASATIAFTPSAHRAPAEPATAATANGTVVVIPTFETSPGRGDAVDMFVDSTPVGDQSQ
jgi:hypothetical protein